MVAPHDPTPPSEQREIHVGGDYFERVGEHATVSIVKNYFNELTGRAASSQAVERQNELVLLERVTSSWIDGLLRRSLFNELIIELGQEIAGKAAPLVEQAVGMDFSFARQSTDVPSSVANVVEAFDVSDRSLLILGAPGAGKTTALLSLTQHLVEAAREDPLQPIPVVFNLSSWGTRGQSLQEWLIDELTKIYLIPRKLAGRWVEDAERHRLHLMLDGLDEVRPQQRQACVEAINEFRREYGLTGMVVTCRDGDYEAIGAELNLKLAIRLQPLTAEQVELYLERAGTRLSSLRTAIHEDRSLQEMARSPLMLNVMALSFEGAVAGKLEPEPEPVDRRRNLLDGYVRRMLERRRGRELYPREKTVHWLARLAAHMTEAALSPFRIEELQPAQLRRPRHLLGYFFLSRLATAGLAAFTCLLAVGVLGQWYQPMLAIFSYQLAVSCLLVATLASLAAEARVQRRKEAAMRAALVGKRLRVMGLYVCMALATVFWLLITTPLLLLPFQGTLTCSSQLFSIAAVPAIYVLCTFRRPRELEREIRPVERIGISPRRFLTIALAVGILPAAIQLAYSHRRFVATRDGSAVIMDTLSRESTWSPTGHPDGVADVVFSMDGEVVATVGYDGSTRLWDAEGNPLATLEKPTFVDEHYRRADLWLDPKGERIVTISVLLDGRTARLWARNGTLLKELARRAETASFAAGGERILVVPYHSVRNDDVRLFDGTGEEVFQVPSGLVQVLEDLDALSIRAGQGLRLRTMEGAEIRDYGEDLISVSTLLGGRRVLTEDQEGVFRLWDREGNLLKVLGEFRSVPGGATRLSFSKASGLIFTRSPIGPPHETWSPERWQTVVLDADGNEVKTFDGYLGVIHAVPGSSRLAFLRDQTACTWNADDDRTDCFSELARDIKVSPDGNVLVTENYSGSGTSRSLQNVTNREARIWKAEGTFVATITRPYADLRFSPDGRFIVTEEAVDTTSPRRARFHTPQGEEIEISRDTRRYEFGPGGRLLVSYYPVRDHRFLAILWILLGLVAGSAVSFKKGALSEKVRPNQGILLSARNALLFGVLGASAFGSLVALALLVAQGVWVEVDREIYSAWSFAAVGIPFGALVALRFGGLDVVRHYALRLVLRAVGFAPLRYGRFLDSAVDRILLRRVGGGWVFPHRLLQEHFRSLRVNGGRGAPCS